MTQTILQKITAEKKKVRTEMMARWVPVDGFNLPIIRAVDWQIIYPEGEDAGGNEEYERIECEGPVTLSFLKETVEKLKAEGITEADFETRFDYYYCSAADVGHTDDYDPGEWASVDLAPLFEGGR
jgi:hypothetical protein|tara:strand:+ start:135 stop:512 length:378 start_codon:yes stop_codon:yes gene_type:complete